MQDKSLIVFGDESKLVEGKIGYYDHKGRPIVVADINQYKDVVSNPLEIAYKMAAAPDMLEVLELLMDDLSLNHHINLNNMIGGSTREVLSKVIAAIAKAKGESK